MRKHGVIPDPQVKPGVPIKHFTWIGRYFAEKRPDVVVHLGDHYDLPSLSSYDRDSAKREFHNRSYQADLDAGDRALDLLEAPLARARGYRPLKVYLIGNHEQRYDRLVGEEPRLEGALRAPWAYAQSLGWKVVDFLEPIDLDGILYAHYFVRSANGMVVNSKRGAPSARAMVQREMQSCTAGHKQGLDIHAQPTGAGIRWGLIAGSCLAPHHRVLTADLRYVPLGTVRAGDKLVSFDEFPKMDGVRSRRYRTGIVEAVCEDIDDLFEVKLGSGKTFYVTRDHQWLTRNGTGARWTRTDNFQMHKGGSTHVLRLMDEWIPNESFWAGWLSGIYDGEGCLYTRISSRGTVAQLTLSQKEGDVLDKAHHVLKAVAGVDSVSKRWNRAASCLYLRGGRTKIAKVLGILRPVRLLPKWRPEMLGRVFLEQGLADPVVSIKRAGRGPIIRIAIDAKTMVVEGYGHHNCYLHQEAYLTPQGTQYWRGVVVKHEVRNGNYNPMFVSLDYLGRRFK